MSHYVTLPSNGADLSSDYGLEYNTQTDFETDLKIPLNFSNQSFEVGLSEFTFRKLWLINLGTFKIINNNQNKVLVQKTIEVIDGISVSEIIKTINKQLFDKSLKQNETIKFENYNNNNILIRIPSGITLEIRGYFKTLLSQRSTTPLHYGIDDDELRDQEILFELNNIVNFKEGIQIKGHSSLSVKCNFVVQNIRYIENLYIYTDIIQDVHVGSSMLKLLKVIPVKGDLNELVSELIYFPHYIPLDGRLIDRIRMRVCDSEGNPIKFIDQHSRVVYKLHFKKINYH